jgi:NAD-dependent DNA ligase
MSKGCPYCGNALQKYEFFCEQCAQDEFLCYRAVKDYLRKYPSSNAMQIANATGISVSKILQYIKNGSLAVVEQEGRRPQQ